MRCGLYGKLPAKRDFIAASVPRAFLRLWEPWIEAGLAAARARAGEARFAEAFNGAPIWRFWLGPAVFGEAALGALMASVDALGRMYPLTLVGVGAEGDAPEPPDVDPHAAWFSAAEDILLDALDPDGGFEALLARIDTLCAAAGEPVREAHGKPFGEPFGEATGDLTQAFAALRREQADAADDAASFWWTIGGVGFAPLAFAASGMPSAAAFADMFDPERRDADLPGESSQDETGPERGAENGAAPAEAART